MDNPEALKLLMKAIRARQAPEEQPPTDPNILALLPDMYRSDPVSRVPSMQSEPSGQQNMFSGLAEMLKNRRLGGNIGDLQYQIGKNNIQANMPINNATIKAMLGYDGNAGLNAQMPLTNGNINFDASRGPDGNRKFYIRLQKAF